MIQSWEMVQSLGDDDGFGEHGEGYVRIALVENRQRIRQAVRNIKAFLSGTGQEETGKDGKRAASH